MKIGYLVSQLKTKIYSVLYKTVLYRLGFGGRVGKEIWEKDYTGTRWDYLASEHQRVHYEAVLGQIKKAGSHESIFDIGCGEGVLYDYLKKSLTSPFGYHGIDISETAVAKGSQKYPGTDMKVVDYDFEHVEGRFKLIIFNEVLYYFIKPVKMVTKAINENLAYDGVIIISMYDDGSGRNNRIWKNIDSYFRVLSHDTVRSSNGSRWNIKIIRSL
jgi:2-polyprenyl-3-methyl-5-hydroxy-6-metoxy-1,4-benzoquinol methylase